MQLEYGRIGKECRGVCKCVSDVVQITCPACEGAACDECKEGWIDLPCCPQRYPGLEWGEFRHYAVLYEKGLPPVTGGALEQSHWFTDACRFYWGEQSFWKAKLGV